MEKLNALQPHCPLCRQSIELAKHGRIHALSAHHWGWLILIKPHAIGGESEIICFASSSFVGVYYSFGGPKMAHIAAPLGYEQTPKGTTHYFPPPRDIAPPIMSIPLDAI